MSDNEDRDFYLELAKKWNCTRVEAKSIYLNTLWSHYYVGHPAGTFKKELNGQWSHVGENGKVTPDE